MGLHPKRDLQEVGQNKHSEQQLKRGMSDYFSEEGTVTVTTLSSSHLQALDESIFRSDDGNPVSTTAVSPPLISILLGLLGLLKVYFNAVSELTYTQQKCNLIWPSLSLVSFPFTCQSTCHSWTIGSWLFCSWRYFGDMARGPWRSFLLFPFGWITHASGSHFQLWITKTRNVFDGHLESQKARHSIP